MSKTEQTCGCGRPTAGAVLCIRCQTTLAIAMVNVSAYYTDLETVATKRARYGSGGASKGSIGKAVPMPVDSRFVNVPTRVEDDGTVTGGGPATESVGNQLGYDVWRTTVRWTRITMSHHADTRGFIGPVCASCIHPTCTHVRRNRWPRGAVRPMLAYLDRQFRWVVQQAWAPELLEAMLEAERRLRNLVDRPADRWYAGKCSATDESGNSCEAELYASVESGTVTCRACETQHDVTKRRDFLLSEAKEYQVTATEAAQALLSWTDYDGTETKLVDRIRKWRDRGHLEVRDVTSLSGRDRHLYRLGDIQLLLIGEAQDAQTRRLGVG